jgi:membrane fusion protein, heavy metal efflux system
MKRVNTATGVSLFVLVCAIAAVAYVWINSLQRTEQTSRLPDKGATATSSNTAIGKIVVSEPAQKNLGIMAKPMIVGSYWKTISVPGMIVDRPGVSDREIVAPAVGTISQILHVPGDRVRPGDALFILRLRSESVQQTEAALYKTTQEIQLAEAQRERLVGAGGAIAQSRVIEVKSEIKRLQVSSEAYRYELRNHGLSDADIDGVANGRFVADIPIAVAQQAMTQDPNASAGGSNDDTRLSVESPAFEIQKLNVGVGQQVNAGDALCLLSNHAALAIEGRAFRDETRLLERSVEENWPVEVDFQEDNAAEWPPIVTAFTITHISNTIDPQTRTFAFLLPLTNQSKTITHGGKTQRIWRFRPGQKVRLNIRVERLDNVFVLPADAVSREGPEAYVFTQNGNTFERKSVHVLFQDREHAIIANDGTFPTYSKDNEHLTIAAVVRGAAAQLNRMTQAGTSSVPKGYHIHADGSLHKNEDEK